MCVDAVNNYTQLLESAYELQSLKSLKCVVNLFGWKLIIQSPVVQI